MRAGAVEGKVGMASDKDPPIEEQKFVGGVTVVDIGDVRVARGFSRRHHASCPHNQMVYDGQERRIWCKDCEKDVEAFDAFKILVQFFDGAVERLNERELRVQEAEKFQVRSIAAKALDDVWRRRNVVPCCPHCKNGLFPEHFHGRCPTIGREYALARLGKKP